MPDNLPDFNEAIKSFRDALIAQGRIGVQAATLFAAKYAAPYALWKQQGDQSAIDDLVATMVMEASAVGIDSQAATEQFMKNALDAAANLALK